MVSTSLIDVTPLASEKLQEVLKEQGEEANLLRVMVTPGGHGGHQYVLAMEDKAADDDLVIKVDSLQFLVDPESAPLIEGAQIDYVDGLMRSGFVISNPNMQTSGGCGGGGGGCGCGGGGGGCGCGGNGGGHGGGGGGCGCGGGGGHGDGGGHGGGCGCGGH